MRDGEDGEVWSESEGPMWPSVTSGHFTKKFASGILSKKSFVSDQKFDFKSSIIWLFLKKKFASPECPQKSQTQTAPVYSYAYTALTEQPFHGSRSTILPIYPHILYKPSRAHKQLLSQLMYLTNLKTPILST